jgi:SAM-dependent methyltransferase
MARRKKGKKVLTKRTADPLRLYEASVQNPPAMVEFIDSVFEDVNRIPLRLREDFCGTALLCADWVRSGKKRTAVGLDIDATTLRWAQENTVASLFGDADRVELLNRNVLEGTRRKFDVVTAFNFSYWVFQEREVLKEYFVKVRKSLRPGGAFIIDLHSGPDAQFQLEEVTEMDGFDYVWEQESFNPLTNGTTCHIHFRFSNGEEIRRAFTYHWRVWGLPELVDVLTDAGFRKVDKWWDGKEGDEMTALTAEDQNLVSWLANLVAWR